MGSPWDIDDEGPEPDYGVFGDVGMERPIPPHDPHREARAKLERQRREQRERTSREFNSHMIHLYNESRRP